MNIKDLFSSRFELETFSVLDWCDNQLHHENLFQVTFFHYKNVKPKIYDFCNLQTFPESLTFYDMP